MDTTAWIKINVFTIFFKEKKTKGSVLQVTEQEPRLATGPGPGGPSLECSVLVELQSEFYTDYASWSSVVPSVTFKLILPPCSLMGSFRWQNSMNSLPQPPRMSPLTCVNAHISVRLLSIPLLTYVDSQVHTECAFTLKIVFFFFSSLEFLRRLQSQA